MFDRNGSHKRHLETPLQRNKGVFDLADMATQARPTFNRSFSTILESIPDNRHLSEI